MSREFKNFIFSVSMIVLCALALLFTTLLLDIEFINKYVARQMVVYILMIIEAFIFIRIIILFNNIRF